MISLKIDYGILIPVLILSALSLVSIYSIDRLFFENQLFNIFVGIVIFLFFSQLNFRALANKYIALYLISIFLLLLVPVFGDAQRGAVRWINVFGVSVQISEIIKPLLLLSLAGYLSKQDRKSFRSFVTILTSSFVIFGFIAYQPDLGNAIIFIFTAMGLIIFAGYPLRYIFGLATAFIVSLPIWWRFLHQYQKDRVFTFINPASDPLGTTYNVTQAIIAIGSGAVLGKGFFGNTQSGLRFLPEKHTDFIFASISETFGLLGATVLIVSFIYLLYRLIELALRSDDYFSKCFIAGTFILISIHFVFNIGMNLGVLPVVGITLLFVSYGGSSILSSFMLLGIVSSLVVKEKNKVIEIR